jgi:DNA-binding transcriptional LysR family regulator
MSFDGRLLTGVSVLTAVIESGSFARAADALGITTSGVSRAVSRLEARLNTRLLDRTTRSMALTDEGRRFYERVKPSLANIEDAAIRASGAADTVRGLLRVNIDPIVSRLLLGGRLGGFLALHPELALEFITRERIGDLVGDGIDVAVRFGEPAASSLVARKLADLQVLTVASPHYLKRHGCPQHPNDLADHDCIHLLDPLTGRAYDWEFCRSEQVLAVQTKSRLMLSDVGTMITECAVGTGIAHVFAVLVRDFVEDGSLVQLLPEWSEKMFPLFAYYPSRHHPAAKVRAFVDFVLRSTR